MELEAVATLQRVRFQFAAQNSVALQFCLLLVSHNGAAQRNSWPLTELEFFLNSKEGAVVPPDGHLTGHV